MVFLEEEKPEILPIQKRWGWILAFGLILLGFSIVLIANLFVATIASVVFFGVMIMLAGVFHLVQLMHAKVRGQMIFWAATGILYILAGIFVIYNPVMASRLFTVIIGVSLAVAGGFRLYLGMSFKPVQGWGWLVFSGLVLLLSAIMIASDFAHSSLWLLGLFVAVDFLVYGISLVVFALSIKPTN
ncbi:HdeD family acid-resistance protein [Martelella alba]|uniref:HdeD family acid-resistance protein n=1 Tax=Martelella alba TaxID=2590451 RepID=A0A506UC76_9HYPH|nr:HdeD family acid-resistance protein [Martelella alba]TPW30574.1 HdeD family acid-resistance protein [Martelella alba]